MLAGAQTDLNKDGVVDSISLAPEPLCGNGGCFYQLKISNGIRTKFDTTTAFLHESAFNIRLGKEGANRIMRYVHDNVESGYLIESELKSNHLKEIAKREIYPTGKDSALYRSLFGVP